MTCPPQQLTLTAGDYVATIGAVGAALTSLSFDGRPLVLDTRADVTAGRVPMPLYSGAVLAPWPNRIGDGRYDFGGVLQQLPLTEVERGCALHGLLLWTAWSVLDVAGGSATLAATVNPQPGYPFAVSVQVRYELSAVDGLRVTITGRNVGAVAAPFGASLHPYLLPGDAAGPMDEWRLTVTAGSVLQVDERLLPTGPAAVSGTAFDFAAGRLLRGAALDHAFGELPDRTVWLSGADGFTVEVGWGAECPWLQLCTIDAAPGPWRRAGLAVEPMTCPPNAFVSGQDVWTLGPDEARSMSLTIRTDAGPLPQRAAA